MATIGDTFKDVFYAGVGAMAFGVEKTRDLVTVLVEKGEITTEQGKELHADLMNKAAAAKDDFSDSILSARLAAMTKDERDAYAAKVAEMAAKVNEKEAMMNEEAAEVADMAAQQTEGAAEAAASEEEHIADAAEEGAEGYAAGYVATEEANRD